MVVVAKDTDFPYLMGKIRTYNLWAVIFLISSLTAIINPWIGFLFLSLSFASASSTISYRKGIQGEKRVSKVLGDLDDIFYLLNDVLLTRTSGNLDHVVLGPNGIFVIETKNYSGRIRCYGDNWYRATGTQKRGRKIPSVSRQVKVSAKMLQNFIVKHQGEEFRKTFVIPVIAFSNPRMELKLKNPTVEVAKLGELVSVIETSGREDRFSDLVLQELVQTMITHSHLEKDW